MSLRIANKVAWLEGELLLPQHFQQLDRYHESLLASRLDAINAMSWGVRAVALDARALQQGMAALVNFEGVLPDGTPLMLDERRGGLPKARAIAGHFPASQRALTLSLSVPLERAGINNYALEGESLRYVVTPQNVFDAARDDREAGLQLAVPSVTLTFGDETRDGTASLPIAALTRDSRGDFSVSDTFIPPCLCIRASPVFAGRIDRLLRVMVARCRTLSEARKITSEGRVEFSAADVTSYLQLSALNSLLPKVHYLTRGTEISPRAAYLVLIELAGQLATFSPDADMTRPLDFNFGDLEGTFKQLFDLNEQLLNVSDTERFVAVPLKSAGNSRHYAELQDTRLDQCASFWLSIETELPRPRVVDEFLNRGKVASHGDIDFILSKNVGGVRLAEALRPPPELPVRPGLIYFQLPPMEQDVYWKHARKDRNLAVWLPPLLEEASVNIKLLGIFGSRS